MSVLKQSNLCAQSNQKTYSTMKRTLGLILLTIIFQQIILTQATDISTNAIEPNPRKAELDCYRLKFILKSLTLRIRRLEADAFHMSKMPFELAEIESWCGNDLQSDMIKRSFDEIDRTGFRGFSKKNFDEIDKVGFRGFMGRK